jgi:hypothetical protein
MKMMPTTAATPDAYAEALSGWRRAYVTALRAAVQSAATALREQLKWGHLVYLLNGPVLLVRAEPERVLFGLWRGQRRLGIEPRLRPGGKYEMATLELRRDTPLLRAVCAGAGGGSRTRGPRAWRPDGRRCRRHGGRVHPCLSCRCAGGAAVDSGGSARRCAAGRGAPQLPHALAVPAWLAAALRRVQAAHRPVPTVNFGSAGWVNIGSARTP